MWWAECDWRPGASLRSAPAGAFGDLDAASARQSRGGRYRRWPVVCRLEGQTGCGVAEIVRNVLGADRLLGEAALEGVAQRDIAMRLQEVVQPLDIVNPRLRAAMGELGEIRQGRRAEVKQVLPLPVRLTDSIVVLLSGTAAYRALVSTDLALTRINWRVAADSIWSTSRVFVWGDLVVLGTASGDAVAYCTDTGAKSWTRTVKGEVRAIGGSGDTLLVGTTKGGLSAFRAPRSCRSN